MPWLRVTNAGAASAAPSARGSVSFAIVFPWLSGLARSGHRHEGQALVADLERLDRELALARVELADLPLGRPAADEVPLRGGLEGGVELDDAAAGARHLALGPLLAPRHQR